MIGKTISHYKIIEKLGEGGMGIVYKAEDTKLARTVAIKFLPKHVSLNDTERERFKIEAKAAAQLNHPNIATIHSIEDVDDELFIVMEYIDGKELKEIINSGPLAIDETLDISLQIAKGLQTAHENGVVHRDIKTANIMLTGKGDVKIMDFGLAKFMGQVGLTKTRATVGTVAYMSPEQARGENVDHRTDIWSFGVVLYEMLTGELPFQGDYEQAVIYSILNAEPKSASQFRSDIPRNIENIVLKTLEKNMDNRYENIQELLKDLKAPSNRISAKNEMEKSIIVLPFVNMSPDPEQEYFSDGLTEEIITDLSRLRDLLVISRSSAVTFKGTKKKLKEIAREVNVQYVLEGSVRKAGNNIRITAQLIDAANDAHLWAEKYSGTLDDVFDIQENVSRSIVDALTMKLSPEEDQILAKRPIENMQAYEYYIKARQDSYTFTKDGLDRAIRYLQNGLEIIGKNSVLYAGMGYVYAQYVNIGLEHEGYLYKAEEYAMKALELEPESSEAHMVLGFLNLGFHGNPKKSIHHFKQSLAIFPDDHLALFWLTAGYGINWGKPKKARQTFNRLIQVDPLNPWSYVVYIIDVMGEGQLDLPTDYLTKWFRMEPHNPCALFLSAQFLAYCSHFKEACALVGENVQPDVEDVFPKLSLFVKYAMEGDKKMIRELLTVDFIKTAKRDAQNSYYVSGLFALSGMNGEAFDWLENAVDRGFINYPFISEYDPFLKNIRGAKRFKKLMEKVKHEWENFKV